MTVKKMRSIMKEKVVPEEIVPQNIINCLIDEDAEPPKPDAFAFLMRLRALGIGSTDFLSLLEGCGAPEGVINRIRENPAMNLQGLILTLENSELTSDDYTRMLLTARQVWERTLTLRLEKSEKISHELEREFEHRADQETQETDEYTDNADEEPLGDYDGEFGADDVAENNADEEYDEPDYDEDMLEMSFTAVFNKINAEIRDGTLTGSTAETGGELPDTQDTEENEYPNDEYAAEEPEYEERSEPSDGADYSKRVSDNEAGGDTAPIVRIDEEALKGISRLEEDDLDNESPKPEDTEERAVSAAAKQKKNADDYDNDEYGDDDSEYDEDSEDDEKDRSGYHTGAIIGSAASAAVLVAASIFIGGTLGGKGSETLHYAKNTSEIFDKVYACVDSATGGEIVCETEKDPNTVFGDLLIGSGENPKSLGLFTDGNTRYSITEAAISANIIENGRVISLEELVPPQDSRFVAAFDENGGLYALFSGKQSGYMKIADGKAEYTVRQDGLLTDYDISDGEIKLGTVYTPIFEHSFDINDKEMYLPKTGLDEPEPISPQDVIISSTEGYSYGISAEYSAENGKMKNVTAVMGDPMAASADGCFVLNGDEGLIVKTIGSKFRTEQTKRLLFAAFGKGVCAVIEETNGEEAPVINLFNDDIKLTAALTGAPADINGLWFSGSILAVSGSPNTIIRVDCSAPEDPKPLSLKSVDGVISGNSAITCETSGGKLTIARCELENGTVSKTAEYSKVLSAEKLATVKLGADQTMVFDGLKSGAAYSYFDGVSVVSEYVVFSNSGQPKTVSVFDDKTGFTAAFKNNGSINAVCAEGVKVVE